MLVDRKDYLPEVTILTFTNTGRAQHEESNEEFDCFLSFLRHSSLALQHPTVNYQLQKKGPI